LIPIAVAREDFVHLVLRNDQVFREVRQHIQSAFEPLEVGDRGGIVEIGYDLEHFVESFGFRHVGAGEIEDVEGKGF